MSGIDFTQAAEDERDEALQMLMSADSLSKDREGGFVRANYSKAHLLATIGVGHAVLSLANRIAEADEHRRDDIGSLNEEIVRLRNALEDRPVT